MEQLERFKLLIGDKINQITNKTILIIGLGGVGGYALEGLVRSGIGRVIIVDNDTIDITNLNRQIISLQSNIGEFKTDVCEKRIHDINPNCEVIKITEFITPNNIELLFKYDIDYIVDACDTIETKKELIRQSIKRNIKLISSMGTGNKLDPTRLKIMDLSRTNYDPIAKILRKFVRDEKIKNKIMVICSDEEKCCDVNKIMPSNSFVPATAGMLCVSYIINDIIK